MKIEDLAGTIKSVTGIAMDDLIGRSRAESVVYARRVFVYILLSEFGISVNGVAELTRRDRTSIYWYLNNMDGWIEWDKKFSKLLKSVKNQANMLHE
jgi:chromosomal replication initiation ATPase DnaA